MEDAIRGSMFEYKAVVRYALFVFTFGTIGIFSVRSSIVPAASPISAPAARPAEYPEATSVNAAGLRKDATITTHLYALQSRQIDVRVQSGAIDVLGDDLLIAGRWGRFVSVSPDGDVELLSGDVPMNALAFQSHSDFSDFRYARFRVADILLKRQSAGHWEVFVTHHYFTGECIRFRLSSTTILRKGESYTVSPAWRTIFDAEPCLPTDYNQGQQSGGRMVTDGPDHLFIVVGDHGRDGRRGREPMAAQTPESHLGKLVRVEVDTGNAEVLALGLRNPQGFARDREGNLWETEHGPQGGDELNVLVAGANYGWPFVSYGLGYGGRMNGSDRRKLSRHEGYEMPVFSWVPSIGISGILVNDEVAFPLWGDDLLIASLKGTTNTGRSIYRLRRNGRRVQYIEQIRFDAAIRDLARTSNGRIALLHDDSQLTILSRSDAPCDVNYEGPVQGVHSLHCDRDANPDKIKAVVSGVQLYDQHCSICHNLDVEAHDSGPHLVGLIGRPVGAVAGYNFTPALRSVDAVWTPKSLEQFLLAPDQFAPGTSMVPPNVTEGEAQAIVNFISGR